MYEILGPGDEVRVVIGEVPKRLTNAKAVYSPHLKIVSSKLSNVQRRCMDEANRLGREGGDAFISYMAFYEGLKTINFFTNSRLKKLEDLGYETI